MRSDASEPAGLYRDFIPARAEVNIQIFASARLVPAGDRHHGSKESAVFFRIGAVAERIAVAPDDLRLARGVEHRAQQRRAQHRVPVDQRLQCPAKCRYLQR